MKTLHDMSAATKNKYYAVSFYYYKDLDKMKISMGEFMYHIKENSQLRHSEVVIFNR